MILQICVPAAPVAGLRHAFRRLLKCKAGTFAVEFALISPVLLLLLLVAFDVSLAVYRKMELQTAAETGVHYGTLRKPTADNLTPINEVVKSNLPTAWFGDGYSAPASVSSSLTCECPSSGAIACSQTCPGGEFRATHLNVQVTKLHFTLFDYPVLQPNFTLTAAASVRLQ